MTTDIIFFWLLKDMNLNKDKGFLEARTWALSQLNRIFWHRADTRMAGSRDSHVTSVLINLTGSVLLLNSNICRLCWYFGKLKIDQWTTHYVSVKWCSTRSLPSFCCGLFKVTLMNQQCVLGAYVVSSIGLTTETYFNKSVTLRVLEPLEYEDYPDFRVSTSFIRDYSSNMC